MVAFWAGFGARPSPPTKNGIMQRYHSICVALFPSRPPHSILHEYLLYSRSGAALHIHAKHVDVAFYLMCLVRAQHFLLAEQALAIFAIIQHWQLLWFGIHHQTSLYEVIYTPKRRTRSQSKKSLHVLPPIPKLALYHFCASNITASCQFTT